MYCLGPRPDAHFVRIKGFRFDICSRLILTLGNPRVSIGEIFGLTPRQRVSVSFVAAIIIHILLLAYWFAIGLVWAGTPIRTVDAVIMSIYGYTAVFGWPVVAIIVAIWWWQGRGYLARRVVLAAVTLLFPVALLLLFAGRVRRGVTPPKLVTN
jgi:hypothetical protein